jgi:hypothetical protein
MRKIKRYFPCVWHWAFMGLLFTCVCGTTATEQSIDAPHGMHIIVKMIGPVTQSTDLQVICMLKHDPAGDKYIEAAKDLNTKLGGMLSNLRERGEFVGEPGETLLFTPPTGAIGAKRVLIIGVGEEKILTLDRLRLAGIISVREALNIGAEHVSFAATLRDQGSTRIDVGQADAALVEQVILAYDTAKRMQTQGLSPKADILDFTIEAGPTFFDGAIDQVSGAVAVASKEVASRIDAPYVVRE